MEPIITKNIRNIALLGHGDCGKTALAESMLYLSKATDRMGKTADGNTVCDFDPEEIRRGYTISSSVASVLWNDFKINLIDTPGYLDFQGEVRQAVRVADAAIIVVDGKAGIEVGTELAWDYASDAGIPKAFFINKFDDPEARFARVFTALRERFGIAVCPVIIPMIDGDKVTGFLNLVDMKVLVYNKEGDLIEGTIPEQFVETAEEYRNMLLESIAETSDELMEKYFAGEEITNEESHEAIHEGIIHGSIVPVFCGAATKLWGIRTLMNTIGASFPRPTARKVELLADGDEKEIDKDGDPAIFVFKTVADPFVGKMSYFKVMNGEVSRDSLLKNTTSGGAEKLSRIYMVRGKKQIEVDSLCCGDIAMTAKLNNTNTNDTLTASGEFSYAPIKYPTPYMAKGIAPATQGDEDKISQGITKLLEEDLTLRYENNAETKQMMIYGLGDIHLEVLVAKLKTRFGISVLISEPKIAYRETITKNCDVEGKHKKQSGGHGQYGHVKIRFSKGEAEGLTFTESTVGGSVPRNYHPAVEKGLIEAMQKGAFGYPMIHLAADLYDGSYHDVDSNELSFKVAASLAYKEMLKKAAPVLLEPVGELQVTVPETMVGDVMGDLNRRRGIVKGMNPAFRHNYTTIVADIPSAEIFDYSLILRALTQGRGTFDFAFTGYEAVPASIAQRIAKEAGQI